LQRFNPGWEIKYTYRKGEDHPDKFLPEDVMLVQPGKLSSHQRSTELWLDAKQSARSRLSSDPSGLPGARSLLQLGARHLPVEKVTRFSVRRVFVI
jgi:hypothetical protein